MLLIPPRPESALRAGGNDPADVSLTICIPTYRRPSLVVRSIRSAIEASRPWAGVVELIVSDNSPEVTREACQAELSSWPGKARYLGNATNIGLVGNLNQCVAHARGRYVLILHDDDYLLPSATRDILAATQRAADPHPVLLFGVEVVDGDGRIRRHQFFKREHDLTPPEALIRVLSDPSFVRAPGIVIRRDVFDTVGTFDQAAGNPNDFDMWLRIAARFGIRCHPATISAYCVHEAAETTRTFTAQTVRTNLDIFERAVALGALPLGLVRECEADWFCQFFLAGASRRLSVGDRQAASQIMCLFHLPEIRPLQFSRVCLLARLGMHLLVSVPGMLSMPVAQWLQYHGSWSTWLQRSGRLKFAGLAPDPAQTPETRCEQSASLAKQL